MFVIKPRASYNCDKKLRSIGIRSFISHGQYIGFIKSVLFRSKLVLESASPDRLPSSSISSWASSLVHKSFNDPMEDHTVIVTFFGEFDKVLACFWAIFQVK